MEDLIKACKRGSYKIEGGFTNSMGGFNGYYVVKNDEQNLRFWNDDAPRDIAFPKQALKEIAVLLAEGETSGEFYTGWETVGYELY